MNNKNSNEKKCLRLVILIITIIVISQYYMAQIPSSLNFNTVLTVKWLNVKQRKFIIIARIL